MKKIHIETHESIRRQSDDYNEKRSSLGIENDIYGWVPRPTQRQHHHPSLTNPQSHCFFIISSALSLSHSRHLPTPNSVGAAQRPTSPTPVHSPGRRRTPNPNSAPNTITPPAPPPPPPSPPPNSSRPSTPPPTSSLQLTSANGFYCKRQTSTRHTWNGDEKCVCVK
ncbi:hypothetical protein J437_LFUL013127 [Ladona fulva]|uniref:Uncharacterized protein n=1 Tax=Ladona fulva TaxID=123851 RepID=A0A8K0KHV2_LADFU|nr:hypothetical protein J437_LFUL013127 [Ladona fulva]